MAALNPSVLTGSLRGKAGSVVFVNTSRGVVIRPRVTPRDPETDAQLANRARLRRAARAWSALPDPAFAAWERYARSLETFDPATGRTISPRAMNLFTTCYSKLLQIDPAAEPPLTPPTRAFLGDGLSFEVSADSASIVVASPSPNSPGIITELLLQPLQSRARRTYLRKYRSAGFHTFTPSSPSFSMQVRAGWYAVAARFVDTATGQSSPVLELGKVRVG